MPKFRTQFAAVEPPPLPTPRLALSIPEFCKALGARTLISFESAVECRRARETQHSRGHRESARSVLSGEAHTDANSDDERD
jgi:hypothetical protein